MKRPRVSGGLSVAEVAARMPAHIRESIRQWPFPDTPLRLPDLDPTYAALARVPSGSVLRFAGVLTGVDVRSGLASMNPYDERSKASASDLRFDLRLGRHARKFDALRGLIMDVSMQIDSNDGSRGTVRDGSIMAVHGVERQIAIGNTSQQGLLRGEISDLIPNDLGETTGGGYEMVGEGDQLFQVYTDAQDESEARIAGDIVAVRVWRDSASEYSLHSSLGWPLQHIVLLQPAWPTT